MSFAVADLNALQTALATGKTEVRIGDLIVKYQTTAELMKAIEYVKGELIGAGLLAVPPTASARTAFLAHSRD